MLRKIFNKKGEIPETLTWVFATPIIAGVLLSFIIIAGLLFGVKSISMGDVQSDFNGNSLTLSTKTEISHEIAKDKNKEQIDNILEEWNNE